MVLIYQITLERLESEISRTSLFCFINASSLRPTQSQFILKTSYGLPDFYVVKQLLIIKITGYEIRRKHFKDL